ncbi:MAG: shikimate dehydrogenase [Deltaproteobacteria bacterium]|nr:shikimate dehydrogenase [Deltaproteobacteria bacterium]
MIVGTKRIAAVLGWPVEHSRSPQMLNAAFAATGLDAVMVPMAVPPSSLESTVATLRAMPMLGASVTVPHKVEVAALCDELAAGAKAIGAVNCLQLDGDRLIGHNTDEVGFSDALAASGFDVRGRRALILGAGGSARAVAYALRGGRAIEVIARRPQEVAWARAWPWTPEQLRECFARADLVVDCTPLGLGDSEEQAFVDALPLDALPGNACVGSLVYHRRPLLLERAAAAGYSTFDGKGMLVHQGARAFTIWTGLPAPVGEMSRALDASLSGT